MSSFYPHTVPSGITNNGDNLSTADSLNNAASSPTLSKDDKKHHKFWSQFKKKTNPVRQFHTLRHKHKRRTKGAGGSDGTPSPSHQCYSEDSDGGRRDSGEWSGADKCFSDSDVLKMKNGSVNKKRHRTKKSKNLSFEDDKTKQLDVPRRSSNIEQYTHSVSMRYCVSNLIISMQQA